MDVPLCVFPGIRVPRLPPPLPRPQGNNPCHPHPSLCWRQDPSDEEVASELQGPSVLCHRSGREALSASFPCARVFTCVHFRSRGAHSLSLLTSPSPGALLSAPVTSPAGEEDYDTLTKPSGASGTERARCCWPLATRVSRWGPAWPKERGSHFGCLWWGGRGGRGETACPPDQV